MCQQAEEDMVGGQQDRIEEESGNRYAFFGATKGQKMMKIK